MQRIQQNERCKNEVLACSKDRTSLQIRRVEMEDYSTLSELLTASYVDFVFDSEVLKAQDKNEDNVEFPARRWLAFEGKTLTGCCEYRQIAEPASGIQFQINVVVHPEYRGLGFGNQLYRFLLEHLPCLSDLSLCTTIRSADTHSFGFLHRRGFVCEQSLQEWELSLSEHENASALFEMEIVPRIPIEIYSVAELQNDRDCNQKLHRLIGEIRRDTLSISADEKFAYERFEAEYLAQPSFFPELTWVAIYTEEYIGYSDLRDDGADGLLSNLTGVLRNYRRRGVANALKYHGLKCAQERGYVRVRTFCAAENTAIQTLNKQWGFEQVSAWTRLCRRHLQTPVK